jgi:hypothetical protein
LVPSMMCENMYHSSFRFRHENRERTVALIDESTFEGISSHGA